MDWTWTWVILTSAKAIVQSSSSMPKAPKPLQRSLTMTKNAEIPVTVEVTTMTNCDLLCIGRMQTLAWNLERAEDVCKRRRERRREFIPKVSSMVQLTSMHAAELTASDLLLHWQAESVREHPDMRRASSKQVIWGSQPPLPIRSVNEAYRTRRKSTQGWVLTADKRGPYEPVYQGTEEVHGRISCHINTADYIQDVLSPDKVPLSLTL